MTERKDDNSLQHGSFEQDDYYGNQFRKSHFSLESEQKNKCDEERMTGRSSKTDKDTKK